MLLPRYCVTSGGDMTLVPVISGASSTVARLDAVGLTARLFMVTL
jgi:hypothetical protein